MGLTKEEKYARKVAKSNEKKRIAEENKKRRKREEYDRELFAHQLWKENISKKLTEAMLRIKIPVYRQQIEVMWHTLERAYDKKNYIIHNLLRLRNVADFQYYRTVGEFCKYSDSIIKTFLSELENICKQNEIKIKNVLQFGRDELAHYLGSHNESEQYLKLLIYASHKTADTLVWNTRGDNVVRKDADTSNYQAIYDTLQNILQGNYCFLWEIYVTTLRSYISKTSAYQNQLRIKRKKEQLMADVIDAQEKKIRLNEKRIRNLKKELTEYESGEKQAEFRDRHKRQQDAYKKLKGQMCQGVDIDTKQMFRLVKASEDTIAYIEAAQKKCDKINILAAQCRKYETRREKIMPYGTADITVPAPTNSSKTSQNHRKYVDSFVFNVMTTTKGLTKLWYRISNTELSKRALIREKSLLEQENAELELKLVEEKKENTFPVTTKCACKIQSPAIKPAPIQQKPVAIDGALEVKKYIHK